MTIPVMVVRDIEPDVIPEDVMMAAISDEIAAEFRARLIAKHASHDQSTHGNWARGYYHGTNVELQPGDIIRPRSAGYEQTHADKPSSADSAYVSDISFNGLTYAVQRAERKGGRPHLYEVEVLDLAPDPEQESGFSTDQFVGREARVVREVPFEEAMEGWTGRRGQIMRERLTQFEKGTGPFPHGPSIKWPEGYPAEGGRFLESGREDRDLLDMDRRNQQQLRTGEVDGEGRVRPSSSSIDAGDGATSGLRRRSSVSEPEMREARSPGVSDASGERAALYGNDYSLSSGSSLRRDEHLYPTEEWAQEVSKVSRGSRSKEEDEDKEFPHGPSIKWPSVYEALRRQGMDKSQAAAISNAHWNKYRRWGRAGAPGPKSAEEYEQTRGRKPRRRMGIPLPRRKQALAKHFGPGPHKGTMTEQSVHGEVAGEVEFDLFAVDQKRVELITGSTSPAEIQSWANDHIQRFRPLLWGLEKEGQATGQYQTRLGSYIQRLVNLYYRSKAIEIEVEKHKPGGVDHDQKTHNPHKGGPAPKPSAPTSTKIEPSLKLNGKTLGEWVKAFGWPDTPQGYQDTVAYMNETFDAGWEYKYATWLATKGDVKMPSEADPSTAANDKAAKAPKPPTDFSSPPDANAFAYYRQSWPEPSFHSYEAEALSQASQVDIFNRMNEDPRWETAVAEWGEMDGGASEERSNQAYSESQELMERLGQASEGSDIYSPHDIMTPSERDDVLVIGEASPVYTDPIEVEVGSTVWTTAIGDYTNPDLVVEEGKSWTVREVDLETGKVILEEKGALGGLFEDESQVDVTSSSYLSDYDPATDFGPRAIEVDYDTLYDDSALWELMERDMYDAISDDIDDLRNDWDQFETEYGLSAETVYNDGGLHDPGDSSAASVDNLVLSDGTSASDPADLPHVLRELWAETAGNDHMWSLAVQKATAEEFTLDYEDLQSSGHNENTLAQADEINEKYGTMLKVWSRAVYNHTQEDLAARGWDMVPIVRGMKVDDMADLGPVDQAHQLNNWFNVTGADLNPLSSWSINPSTSRGFGRTSHIYSTQIGLRAWVPRQQIWGHSLLGNGSMGEMEVILLGGTDGFEGQMLLVKGSEDYKVWEDKWGELTADAS